LFLLNYLFQSGQILPAPFPDCGASQSPAGADSRCGAFTCR
jgi:hypothetical protein